MKLVSSILAVLATVVPTVVSQCAEISETRDVLYTIQGGIMTFDFGSMPPAAAGSLVRVAGYFEGDINGSSEYAVTTDFFGNRMFRLGAVTGPDTCPTAGASRTIPPGQFNGIMALAGGNVIFHMDATPNVDVPIAGQDGVDPYRREGHIVCAGSFGSITLTYVPAVCAPNPGCPPIAAALVVIHDDQGATYDFDFGALPAAASPVTIVGAFFGDISGPNEYAVTSIFNGNDLFTLGAVSGANTCRADSAFTMMSAANFNNIISPAATVDFQMDVTPNVDSRIESQDSIDPWTDEGWIECPNSRAVMGVFYIPATCGGPGGDGDPHFKTWKNEHFEFHGQCDVVMTSVKDFAQAGIDLDIHIRTSMVRYWSYIKTAVIRIGNDILEIQGSADKEDGEDKRHYWLNYEYRAPLSELSGFPVTISPRNNMYTIDTSSVVPGSAIQIKTFKEFVSVKFVGASEKAFGNAVGILGDFKSGKTVGRDGVTEINDYNDLGLEWQVLPSDDRLFREPAHPQFPELCLLPEDPRGERRRRLEGSGISMEDAETACSKLSDALDRKDCVYDVLATQDMDMAGAF